MDSNPMLLSEADIDASTDLTRAFIRFCEILGASPGHNPDGLTLEEVVRKLARSEEFWRGLERGALRLLIKER